MIWNWTSQFENVPVGYGIGSITAYEIRRHKGAFGERFSAQHNLGTGDPPVCTHKGGECSVVFIEEEDTATPTLVEGALQYHKGSIKRDTGVALAVVGTIDHLELLNVDQEETEHPDYIITNNSLTYEELDGDLDMGDNEVTGLPSSGFDDEKQVLSRLGHLGVDGVTGCKHEDECITSLFEIDIGGEKLKTSNHEVEVNTVAWHVLDLGEYAFLPRLTTAGSGEILIGMAVEVDNDDYHGRFQVYCPTAESYILNYDRLLPA